MPSRVALNLTIERPGQVRPRHLRAFVTNLLETDDTNDHHSNIKPFTVDTPAETDAGISLLISTLRTDIDRRLLQNAMALAASDHLVKIGQLHARFAPDPVELVQHADYSDLRAAADDADTIDLEFLSPTVFRSGRRGQTPFPMPNQVFGHYRSRWNAFAPSNLQCDLAFDDLELNVVAFEGRGMPFSDGYRRGQQIVDVSYLGYVGTASFRVEGRKVAAAARRWLQTLAAFGEYAGTGANTTIGMGMTLYRSGE